MITIISIIVLFTLCQFFIKVLEYEDTPDKADTVVDKVLRAVRSFLDDDHKNTVPKA